MSVRMNVAEYVAKRLVGLVAGPTAPASPSFPLIATHDGNFHCDEAMACGLLRHTAEFHTAQVVRTRIPAQHALCNIVVDVGAVYDASKNLLDHHQPEFQDKMHTGLNQYNTRLSSAGLVYKHYGQQILAGYVDACIAAGALERRPTEAQMTLLYDKVYKGFMEHVDGIDNGVEEFSAAEGASIVRNYTVPTTLSARVAKLYPRWNEPSAREDEDNGFIRAVTLTTLEFFEAVDFYACSWLPARSIVEEAFAAATSIHESGNVLVLASAGCPWKEHLMDIEKEKNCLGRTIYVLFSDGKGSWRVQCVPKENASFQNRKSLPWKGLRDDDLSKASGIDGGIFVHASGFIGGNKSFEGAKAMAIKALEMSE
jgi:uncharacterized UPF0160 family protein